MAVVVAAAMAVGRLPPPPRPIKALHMVLRKSSKTGSLPSLRKTCWTANQRPSQAQAPRIFQRMPSQRRRALQRSGMIVPPVFPTA